MKEVPTSLNEVPKYLKLRIVVLIERYFNMYGLFRTKVLFLYGKDY